MRRLFLVCLLALPTGAVADGYGFMTPSGNIYCNGAVEVSEISCTIVEISGPPALPKPENCAGTWGHTFKLAARGQTVPSCSNPPQRVDYTDVAPYGATADFGDISCASESTGLTCRNADGHGFSLSRGSQRMF